MFPKGFAFMVGMVTLNGFISNRLIPRPDQAPERNDPVRGSKAVDNLALCRDPMSGISTWSSGRGGSCTLA